MQYEGFEPTVYDEEAIADGLGTAVSPSSIDYLRLALTAAQDQVDSTVLAAPLFELGRVQYTLPAPLLALAVSSDLLTMGLANNVIVQIELSRSEQVVKIQIPRKPTEFSIHKLFLDPSGRHLVITSLQGENWYLYRGWKKPRQLKTWKMVVESIAWNKAALLSSSHSLSTREMLVGTKNGAVFEAVLDAEEDFFKSQERYLQAVYSLPERQPVTGLKFDFFPPSDPRKAHIIITTPTRIYQFVGMPDRRGDDGGRIFLGLFASYKDSAPSQSFPVYTLSGADVSELSNL